MTGANRLPKIPWWVRYWTDPTTTRSSLRQQCWMFILLAAVGVGMGAFYLFWRPPAVGVIVLPVAFGLMPVVGVVAAIWVLAAARWIDRHQAWDRLATKQEREGHEATQTLWRRSLPLGSLLMAVGAAVGALVGWVWGAEDGIALGLVFGVLSGFVSGVTLAGFREGIQPMADKAADVNPRDAGQSPTTDDGCNDGST